MTETLELLCARVREELDPLDADPAWLLGPPEAFEVAVVAAIRHVAGGDTQLAHRLEDHLLGWGPLAEVWRDPTVEELSVNARDSVWVVREGNRERVEVALPPGRLRVLLDAQLARVGTQLTRLQPLVDTTLRDGSRISARAPGVSSSPEGSFTLRRQRGRGLELADLERSGVLDPAMNTLLAQAVRKGRTILVAGSLGAGKTTLLGALLLAIPPERRVEVLEDVVELPRPPGRNIHDGVTRAAGAEGAGAVTHADLLRSALRSGADVVVLGEVRSEEAAVLLEAMLTFEAGCLGSIHGDDASAALARFVQLAIRGGADERTVREQVVRAVDFVVYASRVHDGERYVRRVTEIACPALSKGEVVARPVVRWDGARWVVEDPMPFHHLGVGLGRPA